MKSIHTMDININNILTRRNFVQGESNTLGILVVGNEIFSEQLCKALQECHKNTSNKYKLYLVTCAKVKEILYHIDYVYVDYVIFLLDTRLQSCATNVEYNLQAMEKSFLCGRCCIVNANSNMPVSEINAQMNAIITLKEKYNLTLFNADVMNRNGCLHLAQRLLIMIKANLGVKKKIPFVPWIFSSI